MDGLDEKPLSHFEAFDLLIGLDIRWLKGFSASECTDVCVRERARKRKTEKLSQVRLPSSPTNVFILLCIMYITFFYQVENHNALFCKAFCKKKSLKHQNV